MSRNVARRRAAQPELTVAASAGRSSDMERAPSGSQVVIAAPIGLGIGFAILSLIVV
jgi:hypothetical protein